MYRKAEHGARRSNVNYLVSNFNMPPDSIDMVGLWNKDKKRQHYLKWSSSDTIANMSHFHGSKAYFLARAMLNPFELEKYRPMCMSVMSWVHTHLAFVKQVKSQTMPSRMELNIRVLLLI